MNEFYYKLLFTFLVIPFSILQVGATICCITQDQPSEDKSKDCGAGNIIQRQNISNTQIASCTELRFFPNNYTLTESLKITAVSGFIINGNDAALHCNSSSLIINNSTRVQIMNIAFINCGYAVNDFVTPRNLFPSLTKAAIILHNSFSMMIKNIIFGNSPGYAIIGVNVMGESYYEDITVSYYKSVYSKQETLQMTGGIILVYSQTNITYKNTNVTAFIKHCDISNINSTTKIEHKGENSMISPDHLSHAIGLIIHQPFCIETQIHNLTVTNITTVNGPLVSVSVQTTELCALNLTLNNSTFSKDENKLYPIVNCSLNNATCFSKQHQAVFTMSNSTFYGNHNATHIFKMNSSANESVILVLEGRNEFLENSVTNSLFAVSGVIPILKNITTFKNNTANKIFTFSEYIELHKSAEVKIIGNKYNPTQKLFNRFLFEKTSKTAIKECPFQISQALIYFCDNEGYYRNFYGNYLQYTCNWTTDYQSNKNLPEYTYRSTMKTCDEGYFIWVNNLFMCDAAPTETTLNFIHPPIYPGQKLTLKLLHSQYSISLYTDGSSTVFDDIAPTCQLDSLQYTNGLVRNICTSLHYIIKSNSTSIPMCLLKLRTATLKNVLHVFKVNISQCPIGFSLDTANGICSCDPKLAEKLKGIECRISDKSFKLPPLSWMSRINDEITFTSFCNFDYCLISENFISLDNPDDQCLSSRSGVACGQCAEGLSAAFGTSRCKKCSNVGLFIIPVLAVIGVILVMVLFMLNLTVVNGNINGFIFFVNTLSIATVNIFTTKKEVAYVLVLLSNLDLGIEMCFYDGMTTYVATWLQFLFPVYLLLIVLGLVIASRYISRVEKITRKKVIPVIATLYLLSYNKIMTVTFRGLFSYNTIGYLYSGNTKVYWSPDTEILVPSTKFVFLSLFCSFVILLLIIPTNILLLFTKRCYHFRLVVTYLKPFIDAYQAPFKDNCRYFLGLELLLRAVIYIVNFIHTKHTAAIDCILTILLTAYLCWQKPFKSTCNSFLYLLYILLLGGISIIFMHYAVLNTGPKGTYEVILNLIVFLAFIETFLIFIYHLWKHILQYYKFFITIETYIKTKFGSPKKQHKAHVHLQDLSMYEKYREELLELSINT